MSDATVLVEQIDAGDALAADRLFPLVYDELKRLAAQRMANERAGQTLSATALVHEVYLRLVKNVEAASFSSQTHFFSAAAEAMRRILIDCARHKGRVKRGGSANRVERDDSTFVAIERPEEAIAVHEALDSLAEVDAIAAELVKLHYFAGFPLDEAGTILGLPRRSAYRRWRFAKVWLRAELEG